MKRAVVIGVDEYSDDRIPNLGGARNDARELSDLLVADGEFQMSSLLVGAHATAEAIRAAISDLLWRTDPVELALFYFSGHAFDDEYGNGYLAPHDMDYERPFVRGLRIQELNDMVRRSINKDVVLVMLDACKSGIAASGDKGGPAEERSLQDNFDLADAEDQARGRGRIVLASSGPDQVSRERPDCHHQFLAGDAHPHGEFTYQVLEGLSGGAATDTAAVNLDSLRSFIERGLHGQDLTFYGSGLQHAGEIHLLTASGFSTISTQLAEAEQHLAAGTPASLFVAIRTLNDIRLRASGNERATDLARQIDARLTDEAVAVYYYVMTRKVELVQSCPETTRLIEQLLAAPSCAALREAGPAALGLMLTLWEASRNSDDQLAFKGWLSQMTSYEVHLKRPAQLAGTPDSPGLGG